MLKRLRRWARRFYCEWIRGDHTLYSVRERTRELTRCTDCDFEFSRPCLCGLDPRTGYRLDIVCPVHDR